MNTRNVFVAYMAILALAASCAAFGTPKVGPCGICEPVTILGKTYEFCGKPAELARLRAQLKAQKVGQ